MKNIYFILLVIFSCFTHGSPAITTKELTIKEAEKLGFVIVSSKEDWATIYQIIPISHNQYRCELFNISSGFFDENGNSSGAIFLRKSGTPSVVEVAVPLENSKAGISFDYICENPSPSTSIRYSISF